QIQDIDSRRQLLPFINQRSVQLHCLATMSLPRNDAREHDANFCTRRSRDGMPLSITGKGLVQKLPSYQDVPECPLLNPDEFELQRVVIAVRPETLTMSISEAKKSGSKRFRFAASTANFDQRFQQCTLRAPFQSSWLR